MKTASSGMITAIGNESTTLCRLWKVTRKDGLELFFTDAVRDVVTGGDTYRADISFTASAIRSSTATSSGQGLDITVFMSDDAISEADLRARMYEGATFELSLFDYKTPANGVIKWLKGFFGDVVISSNGIAIISAQTLTSRQRYIDIESYSPGCRANLGDARCTFDIDSLRVDGEVTAFSFDRMYIEDNVNLTQADNYWQLGLLVFTSGASQDLYSEVALSVQSLRGIGFFTPFPFPIQVGDTFSIYPGCDKQLSTCKDRYDNILNFRGEPFSPATTV